MPDGTDECRTAAYSGEQDEVHMPRMVDPQKVLVMLPVDLQNRPAVGPKAAGSTGVMPGQAPGECSLRFLMTECVRTKVQSIGKVTYPQSALPSQLCDNGCSAYPSFIILSPCAVL